MLSIDILQIFILLHITYTRTHTLLSLYPNTLYIDPFLLNIQHLHDHNYINIIHSGVHQTLCLLSYLTCFFPLDLMIVSSFLSLFFLFLWVNYQSSANSVKEKKIFWYIQICQIYRVYLFFFLRYVPPGAHFPLLHSGLLLSSCFPAVILGIFSHHHPGDSFYPSMSCIPCFLDCILFCSWFAFFVSVEYIL